MLDNKFFSTSIPDSSDDYSYCPDERAFKKEADLVSLFKKTISQKLSVCSDGYLDEFECGIGIADIILYKLRKDWRISAELAEINPRWAYALKCLPYRRNFSTTEFTKQTGTTENTAIRVLESYVLHGFCTQKLNKDIWVKNKQPRLITSRIYAIEAKLRDWKKALWQASRYQYYAHEAWGLLDAIAINAAKKNIEQFQRLNIGLAGISTVGSFEIYFKPQALPPKSELRLWEANTEIARRIKSRF